MTGNSANEVSGPHCRESNHGVAIIMRGDRVGAGARVKVCLCHLEHVVLRRAVAEGCTKSNVAVSS